MFRRLRNRRRRARFEAPTIGGTDMAWKTPKIVEIALGAEINCYACAEL
jgi:coenzyme PQQ precursor peptide PqqA